jgi:GntR family transcriptional repressor for pyruvate dehydrogenase complex
MPFQPVEQEKLSTSVVRQIELLILRGILQPGDKLPPERELADKLAVSRPSLRAAISDLQSRGLLVARQGAGVYVEDVLGSAFSDALIGLFSTNPEALFDTISFRRDIESLAAERAARVASTSDLNVIQSIFDKMQIAHDNRDTALEARLDAEFHLSIIEAGHNIIMLHMMRSMYDLLKRGVFYNRRIVFEQRNTRQALLDQHRAINEALQARDPEAAKKAVVDHLDFVRQALQDKQLADQHEMIAKARLEQEIAR